MEEKSQVTTHFQHALLREQEIQTSFLVEQAHRVVLIGECILMTLLFGTIAS